MNAEAPEWIDDLDDSIMYEDEPTIPESDDVEAREWVNRKLRRIAFLRRERNVIEQIAANERARIDAWAAEKIGQLDRGIAHHEGPVLAWAAHMNEVDPKTRTRSFPAGDVKARKLPDLVEIDDDVCLPWLLEHRPDLVRTKQEVNKAQVLGEADLGDIPGIAVTTGRVKFSVKVSDL